MVASPEDILAFWLDECEAADWYRQDDALDDTIRDRFLETYHDAMRGKFALWLTYPNGALAYIILLDQFPRNMFRGSAQAFAGDRFALSAAKQAIHRGWDLRIDEPARQFFYMPLMHSENLCDQDRCVRLMKDRMPECGDANLIHARVHREIIRQFGRFPYRNDALSRHFTAPERAFVEGGGYGETLRSLEKAA